MAPFTFDLIAGGRSNLTFRVTGADGTRYVLRRPPVGLVLASHTLLGDVAVGPGVARRLVQSAAMSGVSEPEYAQMMLDGGRSIDGVRSKTEPR